MRLPVPGSEIFGSAELRKRKHENKTGGNWEEKGRLSLPFSRPANFSRTFFFRVFPTIWEPGTGYPCTNPQLIVVLSFGRLALDLAHTVFSICTFSIMHLVCPPPPPTPTKKLHDLCRYYSRPKRRERQCLWCIMGDEQMVNIERIHMMSVAVPKQKKRPCWCCKPILSELNLFSFVQ